MKRLFIAGGGTGGHLYPGVAVADRLKGSEVEIMFLVSDRGLEKKILTERGYSFCEQPQTPLKGVSIAVRIRSMFRLFKGVLGMLGRIGKEDTVLLTGGFAAGAPAIAAVLKGAGLYIHEQNSVMGLTNRLFARFCKKVFLSFDDTRGAKGKTDVSGNPVRAGFESFKPKERQGRRVLVLGGSQGSRFLNRLLAESAKMLQEEGFEIVHQTGLKLFDEAKADYEAAGADMSRIELKSYIDNVFSEYKAADVIVARAGSGTVFEATYSKRPSVFVPFAGAADNHQYHNARYAERQGTAKILEEKEATPAKLTMLLRWAVSGEAKEALEKVRYTDSAGIIVRGMELD
jgi:UDP-N-acetylglucosamine--N-acetylmuramyl-(pentapeptide) pyrophosphoryl-undecaprenol N-acetylglucosamine transferase